MLSAAPFGRMESLDSKGLDYSPLSRGLRPVVIAGTSWYMVLDPLDIAHSEFDLESESNYMWSQIQLDTKLTSWIWSGWILNLLPEFDPGRSQLQIGWDIYAHIPPNIIIFSGDTHFQNSARVPTIVQDSVANRLIDSACLQLHYQYLVYTEIMACQTILQVS